MTVPVKILSVDDHPAIGAALRTVFSRCDDFAFLGHAHRSDIAIQMTQLMRPDIVLLDFHMSPANGADTTEKLLSAFPLLKIIGFSFEPYQYQQRAMLAAGARRVISKTSSHGQLIAAVREVAFS